MFEVSRANYISELKNKRSNGLVKIITGIRVLVNPTCCSIFTNAICLKAECPRNK